MKKDLSIDTIAVHSTYIPDETGATNPPLYLSNAYKYKNAQHAADLFDLKTTGYIYTRLHNPTTTILEDTITKMEGGSGAVATSSGHFAEIMLITCIASFGDEIIASNSLYGGTINMFSTTLKRFGINVKFADQDNPSSFEALINDKTKAIFIEALANPASDIADFEVISKIANKHKLPLIIDSTCATPYLFRPIEVGAAAVIHSGTKFLGGHGDVMGGIAVDLGTFDWSSGRFPSFTEKDMSYHGVIYAKDFGNMALAVKMRAGVMRDMGGTPSPYNSYAILQGMQTLHLRMERHVSNAVKLANWLMECDKVSWVNYPSLKGNKNYEMAKKYFPKGAGSMLTFGVKGGIEAGRNFIDKVNLAIHAANLGDVKTIVTHPASTTHRQLSQEQRIKAGVPDDLIRVSVGIEDIEDIINDFKIALS